MFVVAAVVRPGPPVTPKTAAAHRTGRTHARKQRRNAGKRSDRTSGKGPTRGAGGLVVVVVVVVVVAVVVVVVLAAAAAAAAAAVVVVVVVVVVG